MLLISFSALVLLCSCVWSYEAPEDQQDVFSSRACPAFLVFRNAAYLSGATVELPCLCKPPQVQSVVWFFRKHQGSSEETRALTDHHGNKLLDTSQVPSSSDLQSRFSIRLFSLLIFRAGPRDSGLYICGSTHKDFFFGYDLDIQESHGFSFIPRLEVLYRPFTSFQPWSVCDRCGVPGEQVRVGLCYVHSQFLHVRYRRTNQTVASCGSGAVPRDLGRIGPTMEVRSCQTACPTETPPSSKLLTFMAFLGYSSDSRTLKVPVFHVNHPARRVLTLGCPGARPDMAVAWDQGSKPIYRSELSAGGNISTTPHRVQIDAGHHLVFQPAQIHDSGVYTCWLQGRRSSEIHLLVYLHLGRGRSALSHPEFPAAVTTVLKCYAVITALFLLLLFCRAGLKHFRDTADTHVD